MEKVRYEVDPHNRLVSFKAGKGATPSLFRQVLDGEFKPGKNNNLTYHIKAPLNYGIKTPYQVRLKGIWSLDKDHNLVFTLDGSGRQASGERLIIRADMISAEKNSLLFAVTTMRNGPVPSAYILKLEGAWQADERNRIIFKAERENNRSDILTFDGIWEIDKRYQISYKYEKKNLARKTKRAHTISFKGSWSIKDKAKIAYIMDMATGSVMNFKASAGIFRGNYIKYEVGIGRLRKGRPARRAIVLFGSWKIKKGAGLVFEVERGRRGIQDISFGAEVRVTPRDTLLFRLKDGANRKLGAELELTRRISGLDGESYIRMLKSGREYSMLAGAGLRW